MYPHDFEMPLNLSDYLYLKELTLTGVFVSPYAFPRALQILPYLDLDELTAGRVRARRRRRGVRCARRAAGTRRSSSGATTSTRSARHDGDRSDRSTPAPALEARDIVKRFDGVHALNGARLDVRPGEIHALLGENGAGKSTLIKVLTGIYAPDAGTLWRNGEEVEFANVRVANRAGVVALYQELSIIPRSASPRTSCSATRRPPAAGIVQWSALRRRAREQLDRIHQKIRSGKLAGELSPVQQTMVAFARALATDAEVLILDEPQRR